MRIHGQALWFWQWRHPMAVMLAAVTMLSCRSSLTTSTIPIAKDSKANEKDRPDSTISNGNGSPNDLTFSSSSPAISNSLPIVVKLSLPSFVLPLSRGDMRVDGGEIASFERDQQDYAIGLNPIGGATSGTMTISVDPNAVQTSDGSTPPQIKPLAVSFDTQAPTPPTMTAAAWSSLLRPTWTWASSEPASAAKKFRMQLDGNSFAPGAYTEGAALSYVPTADLSEGTHHLYVMEQDLAGNWSTAANMPLLVDATAPTAAQVGAGASFAISGTDNTKALVSWDAAATDSGSGIAKQELLLYGGDRTTCAGTPDAVVELPATATSTVWNRFDASVVSGVSFRIRAEDNVGHVASSACSGSVNLFNGIRRWNGTDNGMYMSSSYYEDLNNDGYPDIISAWQSYDSNRGVMIIVLGGPQLINHQPIVYTGANTGDRFGAGLQFVDINNDGYKDIISFSSVAAPGGVTGAGTMHIILGGASLPASGSADIVGRRYYGTLAVTGSSISSPYIKDINGDGRLDMVISANSTQTNKGSIWLMMGSSSLPPSGSFESAMIRYDGDAGGDYFGEKLTLVDITGDGKLDIVSSSAAAGGSNKGAIYVILGATTMPASGAISSVGYRYNGVNNNDAVSVSIIDDITGDGRLEIIGGSSLANNGAGASSGSIYVISPTGASSMPASDTIANAGRRYDGEAANDVMGGVGLAVMDLNGDGIKDIFACYSNASSRGFTNNGSVYVIKGSSALPASGAISVRGLRYDGPANNYYLCGTPYFFNIDGDAAKELILTSPTISIGANTNVGSIFVLPGSVGLPANNTWSAIGGLRYDGTATNMRFGWNLAVDANGVGYDVTGDGISDLVIDGKNGSLGGIADNGGAFVIPGSATTLPASGTISTVGYQYYGALNEGFTLFAVEDVTGDGIKDILVRSRYALSNRGSLAVIRGGSLPASGTLATAGRRYDGITASDRFFDDDKVILTDVTGDGVKDIITSTEMATNASAQAGAGAVWILPGESTLPASGDVSTCGKLIYGGAASAALQINYPYLGFTIADIDGDGIKDMLVQTKESGGKLMVIYGAATTGAMSMVTVLDSHWAEMADIAAAGYMEIRDADHDGLPDIVVSAYGADSDGFTDNGAVFFMPNRYIKRP